jgi:hypothetical protein
MYEIAVFGIGAIFLGTCLARKLFISKSILPEAVQTEPLQISSRKNQTHSMSSVSITFDEPPPYNKIAF